MEEKQQLKELLERLDESNKKQARYAKWQCIFSVAAALSCLGLFLLVYTLMPQVETLAGQTQAVLTNLESISGQLAQTDLSSMVKNVDTLVTTTQEGVDQAMANLNAIDFVTLNETIRDLADVVEPLANFFNVFR